MVWPSNLRWSQTCMKTSGEQDELDVSSGSCYLCVLCLTIVPWTEAALCFFQPLHVLIICFQLCGAIMLLHWVLNRHYTVCSFMGDQLMSYALHQLIDGLQTLLSQSKTNGSCYYLLCSTCWLQYIQLYSPERQHTHQHKRTNNK